MKHTRCRICGKDQSHTHKGKAWEVRHQDKDLDEVVATGRVHLERMSEWCYLLIIDAADGTQLRVPIWCVSEKHKIVAGAELDI